MKLADLVVGIGANTKSLDDGLGKARRKLKAFGRNTKQLGKDLSMGVSAPLLALGAAAVKSAADLETMETSFISLTGGAKQAADMMRNLNEFTAKTPFQIEEVAKSARQLIASGSGLNEVNEQLQFLGDIAATSGQPIDEIAAIFAKVNAKGKVELENLNQLAERGIPIFTALSEATGLPADKLGAGAVSVDQFNEVLKSFAAEGGFAAGAMERLSETAAGKFSTALDNLKLAGAELAESLMPVLKDVLDRFTALMQRITALSPETKQLILVVGGVVAAIGPLLVILPSLAAGIKVARTAMLAFNMAMLANPLVLAAAAITAIGVAMYGLYSASNDAEDEVNNLRDELKGLDNDEATRRVTERIREQEEAVKKQRAAVQALRAAANMGDATERRIHSQTLARQQEVLDNEEKKLEGFKREAFILEGQGQYQEYAANKTREKADAEGQFANNAERSLEAAKKQAEQFEWIEDFKNLMREDIFTQGASPLEGIADDLEGIVDIPNMMDDFEDDFIVDEVAFEKFQKAENRAKAFQSVMGGVLTSLADGAAQFGNQMGHAFGAMAQGAEDGKDRMKEATKGIINQSLAAAQASIIEAMINSGKFTGPAAPIVIPALVATGIGLVQSLFSGIPAFADGGIVSGPTLGLMGEYPGARSNPEVIAPLDKLQGMLQASPVVVTGRISGNDIRLSNDRSNRNAKRFLR